MSEIRFTCRGEPIPQGSMKAFVRPGARFAAITNDNPRTRPWRQLVAAVAQQHAPPMLWDGPVELELAFFLPRPKSLPRKVVHHVRKPDGSKLLRGVEDALTGIIYFDDRQVTRIVVSKDYGDPPRVDVVVRRADFVAPKIDLAARVAELEAAIRRTLADDESGPGGWGPDVTMQDVLRRALAGDEALAAVAEAKGARG